MNRFWLSSILCAILARRIAKKISYNSPEEAFLAGILHDIGELLLWSHFCKPYSKILEQWTDPNERKVAEKRTIGADHCELGAWLTKEWHLNRNISDAISLHHDKKKMMDSDYPLSKIIYCANHLSTAFLQGRPSSGNLLEALFAFPPDECRRLLQDVKDEVLDVAASIGLRLHFPAEATPAIENDEKEQQKKLTEEVRYASILNGTLQHLLKADKRETIFNIARRGLQILFSIDKTIFFLHESRKDCLTTGRINLKAFQALGHQHLFVQTDHSLPARCFRKKATLDSFEILTNETRSPADDTLIAKLDTEGSLCIPLIAHQNTIGVMMIGLSRSKCIEVLNQMKILTMFAGHVAMSLHVEQIKQEKLQIQYEARMATYTQFARHIVHEVNNPLSIIKNYLKILATKLPEQNNILNDLKIMDEELKRINQLILNLRHFSNPQASCSEGIDINQILSNLVSLFSKAVLTPAGIMVRMETDPSLPFISSNANLLKQVFVNLIKNAAEAMPHGGIITIQTRKKAPSPDLKETMDNEQLEGVQIIIRDNGSGIPESVMSHLFEPFNSSKASGHSGLGLSVVYHIIQQLSGSVECESTRENGTSFTIYLPLSCKAQPNQE
jgi:signal transduction histidine kinase